VISEKVLSDLRDSVTELKKPLYKAQEQQNNLLKSVSTLDKDTTALRNTRGFLKDIKAKTRGLKENRETLEEKFK